MENIIDKIKGTIYGQAIGDALGLGTEGMTEEEISQKYPNGIAHYSDIYQDRHRRRWKIGDWTDDTDMMLCIANAVIKDKGVNLTTIAQNFKDWAMGEPMGIGQTTYKVLNLADYVEKPCYCFIVPIFHTLRILLTSKYVSQLESECIIFIFLVTLDILSPSMNRY
jgi:hypothetical protein